ncbi:hypothetical protein PV327_010294 [Microctonus hyperodae]|uniref:RING-type E3 ubiquitin transferase n=1 Tax=Microctonus hyperodae TaxID=165561 RepID=A0AA39KUS7_MICHY|nr:hypothetical protein PV327_010294 [Microctonus hyperodae]
MDNKSKKILQFLTTFEVMIKCPICDNKLRGNIYLCGSGHSICNFCYNKGSQCKQCNSPFTKMQNLLLQNLISKFNDLKMDLDESNNSEIQLKSDKIPESSISTENSVNSNNVKSRRNKFPCLITDNCDFIGSLTEIIKHFETSHPLEFQQKSNENLPYKTNWQMNYFTDNNLNRAFNIANDGLFILHISKDINKQFKACILMYAKNLIAKQHSYRIEIECNEKKLSYNGKVESVSILKEIIISGSEHKCLLIEPNKPLYNELKDKIQFKCSITLKKDDLSTNINTNSKINEEVIKNQLLNPGNSVKSLDQDNKSTDLNIDCGNKKKNKKKKKKSLNKQSGELNNDKKNQEKIIDGCLNKQLTGSKLNLCQPQHQLNVNNEQKQMENNFNSFPNQPEIIYRSSCNNYNQFPPQSNQFYPNFGPHGMNMPRPFMNILPPHMSYDQMACQFNGNVYKPSPMMNNSYNNRNIIPNASEISERQSTIDPYYQHQQMMNSNDKSMMRQKSKN